MADLTLRALDGFNPLGWLAAVGTLVALDATRGEGEPRPRLSWAYAGRWTPTLSELPDGATEEGVVDRVMADLARTRENPAFTEMEYEKDGKSGAKLQRDLKPPPEWFRQEYLLPLQAAAAGRGSREALDLAAAFATDVAVDKSKGNTKPTALHFTAGQQQFLVTADEVVEELQPDDVEEALFGGWSYTRVVKTFSWDASDYRDYALRADDPSSAKKYSIPGADWLAFRALPLLPCVPQGSAVVTTLCTGSGNSMKMHWPLWSPPLSLPETRALLARADLLSMSPGERRARGIAEVLRSDIVRSDQGYGSFAPPAPVVASTG